MSNATPRLTGPTAGAPASAASSAWSPSIVIAARIPTIWLAAAYPVNLRLTRSSATGSVQSSKREPVLSAPGLRAHTGT